MKEIEKKKSSLKGLVSASFQEYDAEIENTAGQLHQMLHCVKKNIKYKRAFFSKRKLIPNEEKLENQRKNSLECKEMVSIVVPLFQTPASFLKEMIDSVQKQTYTNWELCLADGSTDAPWVEAYCARLQKEDARIHYRKLKENKGIAGNTNEAMQMAKGTYIALLDHDDLLHPSALYGCVKKMKKEKSCMVYTDEMTFSGNRITNMETVHRKPDFAPETLKSVNYICHLVVFEKKLLEQTGGMREAYNGSQDHEFLLRLTQAAGNVSHVPQILYFWRVHEQSVSKDIRAKWYAVEAGKCAVRDYEAKNGRNVEVFSTHMCATQYRLEYKNIAQPAVRILLVKDRNMDTEQLERRKQLIEENTEYPLFQVEIIECIQEKDIVKYEEPYVCILSVGMEPIQTNWLQELVQYATLPQVAAVGAKVIDLQGMTKTTSGVNIPRTGELEKENPLEFVPYMEIGYMGRNFYAHNVDALYQNGILIRTEAWKNGEIIYLEEEKCMQSKRRMVYQPYAVLVQTTSQKEGWMLPQKNQIRLEKVEKPVERWKGKWKQATDLVQRYGIKELLQKKKEHDIRDSFDYPKWYERCAKPTQEELQRQREVKFLKSPCISIVVPTYETEERFLKELLESVIAQTYPNWQLCIADGSRTDRVKNYIQKNYSTQERITYKKLEKNKGIAENTNEGLKLAKGDFIALLDHDDRLAEHALYEVVNLYQMHPDAEVFYSDEDKIIDETGEHVQPHLKPDLNWFLLRANNYICHFFVVKKTLVQKIGGFDSKYDGAQDYDFILRCVEQAKKTCHVPKILYHWRMHAASTAVNTSSKQYAYDAGKRAIEAHLKRQHLHAEVQMTKDLGFYKTCYQKQGKPKVECLTPEMAQYALSEENIRKQSADYFIICSLQVKPREKNWKDILIATAQCPGVGIVGCRAENENKKLLHAAVTFNLKKGPVPIYAGLPDGYKGLFSRAVTCQNVSLIGDGCYVVSREALQKAGGISTEFKGCYAVYDLCMRMQKVGFQVVYQPAVTTVLKGKNRKSDVIWEQYIAEDSKRNESDNFKIRERDTEFLEQQRKFFLKWEEKMRDGDRYYHTLLSTAPANYCPKGLQKK